jgi:hypothetical protein
MSSANDFSIFASDDTNFMGGLLSVVNWQVAEEHNLKHKRNVDGTLVSDLKLLENLWRALIAGTTSVFNEIVYHQDIFGGVIPVDLVKDLGPWKAILTEPGVSLCAASWRKHTAQWRPRTAVKSTNSASYCAESLGVSISTISAVAGPASFLQSERKDCAGVC